MTIDSKNFWMSAASLLTRISTIVRLLPMRHIQLAVYLSLAIASVGFGQPTYTIQEIPPVGGYDITQSARINDNGTVAGWLEGPNADTRPIIFRNGVTTQIGGGKKGQAFAINNKDGLVGRSYFYVPSQVGTSEQAAVFDSTSTNRIISIEAIITNYSSSVAYGVNDSGVAVGSGYVGRYGIGNSPLVFYDRRTTGQLQVPIFNCSGTARDVNNGGTSVGGVVCPGYGTGELAVRWSAGGITFLTSTGQTSPVSSANAINDGGNATGHVAEQLALWLGDTVQLLGTFPGSVKSLGLDINDSNTIVGEFDLTDGTRNALLYQNGQMYDLQQRLVNGTGWDLLYANGINNQGQIVGVGYFNGKTRAFLLTPQ